MSNPAYDKAHSKSIVLAKRRILIEHNLPSVRKNNKATDRVNKARKKVNEAIRNKSFSPKAGKDVKGVMIS